VPSALDIARRTVIQEAADRAGGGALSQCGVGLVDVKGRGIELLGALQFQPATLLPVPASH